MQKGKDRRNRGERVRISLKKLMVNDPEWIWDEEKE